MGGALLSFATMAVGARELSGALHTFQILVIRSSIGLLVVSLILMRKGWGQVRTQQLPLHFCRNSAHFCGQFAWFYALGFIPMSAVFAIELTTPLWTALLAVILLGERMTVSRASAIGAGIAGVLVILRPGASAIHPAALGMLGGAMAYGLTHTLTKKLAAGNSSLAILFYMMSMQLLIALVPASYYWVTPRAQQWPLLLLIGIAGLSAHYCLIRALLLADATVVIPMDFLRLPLIALVGYLLYRETVDVHLVAGSLLILAGLMANLFRERRKAAGKGGLGYK